MNVTAVNSPQDMDRFIRLPLSIYGGDKNWVPPLVDAERKMLDAKRNPFYERTEAAHFLLSNGNGPAGRISAFVCRGHNDFHGEKTGFWGYF